MRRFVHRQSPGRLAALAERSSRRRLEAGPAVQGLNGWTTRPAWESERQSYPVLPPPCDDLRPPAGALTSPPPQADAAFVKSAVTSSATTGLRAVIMGVGGTCMLCYLSPTLAAVSLALIPPVAVGGRYFGRSMKERQRVVQDRVAEANAVAEWAVASLRSVRALGGEPTEERRYADRLGVAFRAAIGVAGQQAVFDGLMSLAANATIVAVLWVGAQQVLAPPPHPIPQSRIGAVVSSRPPPPPANGHSASRPAPTAKCLEMQHRWALSLGPDKEINPFVPQAMLSPERSSNWRKGGARALCQK